MEKLIKQIDSIIAKNNLEKETDCTNREFFAPFDITNYKLSLLLAKKCITIDEYNSIISDYQKRNPYLPLYDIAPRTFGQSWGENHILKTVSGFTKATKKNLKNIDDNFDGEYDLWVDNIRVEVKACRANDSEGFGNLSSRAYTHKESKDKNFKFHFQQLKPSCCDVFIWIGVCKDELLYWVLTSDELLKTNKLGPQHRNKETKTEAAIFEGQVFMTKEELKPFVTLENDILKKVKEKGTTC